MTVDVEPSESCPILLAMLDEAIFKPLLKYEWMVVKLRRRAVIFPRQAFKLAPM